MTRPPVIADQPRRQHRRHRRRLLIGRLSVLAAGTVVLMAGGAGPSLALAAGPAGRPPRPMTADLSTAGAPFGEYVGRLSFDVTSVDPALVTAAGPAALTITGTMTNAGPEPLTDLSYRFQRGPALDSEAGVRKELAQPSEPVEHVQKTFAPITPQVPAKGTVPFSFSTSIIGNQGLAVDSPGVYPLMVNVNGAVTLEGGPLAARVGELHLLLTVTGVPGAVGSGTAGGVTARALPVNFVWPLVDRPHLGVGGVFLDDDLLAAISPGGRLATLVDGLIDPAAATLPADAVTVVIDPQLLDELDRMTTDYRVVAAAGDPQPPMTAMLAAEGSSAAAAPEPTQPTQPTRTGRSTGTAAATPNRPEVTSPTTADATATTAGPSGATPTPTTAAPTNPGSADIPGTVAGTGQAAAASFLNRLRGIAARYPVLVLPYGDPDVVALVRAGLVGEVAAAVQHGTEVATRLLRTGSTAGPAGGLDTTMAYPIDGAVDSSTLAALRADGLGAALLAQNSVESSGPAATARVAAPTPAAAVAAAVAHPDVLSGVDALIDHGRPLGWAKRVNALTGVLAQQSLDGTVTPAVFTPDRRWSPDSPGVRVLTDLLTGLRTSGVITGIPLAALAASATTDTTAAYPEQARARELPAGYLDRIRTDRVDVAGLRQSLAATKQRTDPERVLEPLDRALDAAASTAFRQDPAVGNANLSTVESTTAGIRNGVEILSAGNSYTLASSTSPLVLTVQNNTPYDVPVRVEITGGERVGLTVTGPAIQVVPAGRSQQVKIPAEVTRSGQFQVTAQLIGADGSAWGSAVHLSVESTAYVALTVVLIVVAGGVLVVMVALRIVQHLRGRPDTAPGLPSRGDRARDPTDDRIGDGTHPVDEPRSIRDVIPTRDAAATSPTARPPGPAPARRRGTEQS